MSENWLWLLVAAYLAGMVLYFHYMGFMRAVLNCFTAAFAILITRLVLPTVTGWVSTIFHLEDVPVLKLHIIVFLIIFIALFLLCKVLLHATDLISSIPIIHGLNQIAGAVLGAALGLVFVWMAFLVVSAFCETEWATDIIIRVQDSKFLQFLWEHNFLSKMLKDAIVSLL